MSLIWSHNFGDGVLALTPNHPKRLQYVLYSDPDLGPAIVVSCVVGAVGSGRFRATLVPKDSAFVGENHANVVAKIGSRDERLHRRVLEGLRSERAAEAMRTLTGQHAALGDRVGAIDPRASRAPRRTWHTVTRDSVGSDPGRGR